MEEAKQDKLFLALESIQEDLIEIKGFNEAISNEMMNSFVELLTEIKALKYQMYICMSASFGEEKTKSFMEKIYQKALDELENQEKFEMEGVDNDS